MYISLCAKLCAKKCAKKLEIVFYMENQTILSENQAKKPQFKGKTAYFTPNIG